MRFRPRRALRAILVIAGFATSVPAAQPSPLRGTTLLTGNDDRSEEMRADIERYLDRALENAVAARPRLWNRDFTNAGAYERSIAGQRTRLATVIGAIEPRVSDPVLHVVSAVGGLPVLAESRAYTVHAVRWSVYQDVEAEGLLLQPTGEVKARVVALPDADQIPEVIAGLASGLAPGAQFARRLAENGCQVLIPALVSRSDTHSGSELLKRFTNQPHREWIYRQAYTFGRHIIGYEVHQVLAAVDWFTRQSGAAPIGIVGWGEGALIALYSAALDSRIQAAFVSGYFGPRERLWSEPIYRNVFGLLREFGDAEIATLVMPRKLLIEPAPAPQVTGPPVARQGRRGSAASGAITTPVIEAVRAEVERARELARPFADSIRLLEASDAPLTEPALLEFLRSLTLAPAIATLAGGKARPDLRRDRSEIGPRQAEPNHPSVDATFAAERQRRRVAVLEAHTQRLIDTSRVERDAIFWKDAPLTTPDAWDGAMRSRREQFSRELMGELPTDNAPLNARTRLLYERPDSTGYEVVLDALPGVTVWGYLLVPKTLAPGERRPLVVAQHGLSGLPADLINEDPAERAHRVYKAFALQLVQRGYAVFVPHFPWRTQEDYRRLQRKANPLGLSIFSFIVAHHRRLLDWMEELPFVDPQRIGLYGLSWGGKVALRVPALERRYALSICSGDFNEWIWKNATTGWPNSYMFAPEPDMFDFNIGPTFGHAEMAAMIAPRAFMVERGHDDGVGTDERVAFEYARVRRLYTRLGIPERTAIEFFNGVHQINAVGTFHFLQRHFNWPPIEP